MRGRRPDPRHLDVEAFAESAGSLEGEAGLSQLARLMDVLRPEAMPADMAPVRWRARGERRVRRGAGPQSWLHLAIEARLAMACQRCLQAMPVPLQLECSYRFVADEATAAEADIDTEEDLLPTTRSLDLPALVEDELLMALPIVPRHDGPCPQPLPMPVADDADLADESTRRRPFEVLGALKRSGSGGRGT